MSEKDDMIKKAVRFTVDRAAARGNKTAQKMQKAYEKEDKKEQKKDESS